MTGRPPHPDKLAIWETFIQAVEDGDTLKQALTKAGAAWGTVQRWIADETNQDGSGVTFASRYARARLTSAVAYLDRAQQAAEDAKPEDVQVKRLQVDTYKWRAAMANPKEYGDRKNVEVSGTVANLHISALRASAKMIDGNSLDTVKQLASPVTDAIVDSVQDADAEQTPNP